MSPTLLVARKEFSADTVQDLIVSAGRQPWQGDGRHIRCGRLPRQLASVLLQSRPALSSRSFPALRGAAPAMPNWFGGQIELQRFAAEGWRITSLSGQSTVRSRHWRCSHPPAGRGEHPDVPTIDEAGVPGLHLSLSNGVLGAQGNPARRHHEAQQRHSVPHSQAARRDRP